MPLNKKDLAVIRKQYPAEHYDIKEQSGKLEITPKKTVIRIFKTQLRKFNATLAADQSFGEELFFKIKNSQLTAADFEQSQVTVEKKVADMLTEEAKKCRTRKIIYLQKLLGGIR